MRNTSPSHDFDRHLVITTYPALAGLPPEQFDGLLNELTAMRFPTGAEVFVERQPCWGFPLVAEGRLKVVKLASNGRELMLYRVQPGGSCIITSSCLLGHTDYNARGIAETDLTLRLIPAETFRRLMAEHVPFRDFVFNLLADRISELMQLVEEVAFTRLDQRLARLLVAHQGDELRVTHQQLADDLGSVREIVSRLLKGFAVQGLVSLGREHLTIVNRDELRKLAAM